MYRAYIPGCSCECSDAQSVTTDGGCRSDREGDDEGSGPDLEPEMQDVRTRLLASLITGAALLGLKHTSGSTRDRQHPFGLPCTPQPTYADVRFYTTSVTPGDDTRVKSFDGTPLGLNVTRRGRASS